MVTIGLEAEVSSITEIAPLVLTHFGVELPPYARLLARAA
jgi:hypothetical protein